MRNQQLYFNGTIVTMDDGLLSVEAVLVQDGRIRAVGAYKTLRQCAPDAELMDLEGNALLPGFIDAHSHFFGTASARLQLSLKEAESFDDIVEALEGYIASNHPKPGEWIVAKDYDHNGLLEKRHPTRELLDKVSLNHPIVLQHQSGHLGVMNSAALEMLGIHKDTIPPEGGTIGVEQGELTGYLAENAFVQAIRKIPLAKLDDLMEAVAQAQAEYASYGVTTVQEGMMVKDLATLYKAYLEQNSFYLDVVVYPSPEEMQEVKAILPQLSRTYNKHLRLGGYKIFLDGTPQGKTAWLTKPYVGEGDDCGAPVMEDRQVLSALELAAAEDMQLLAHCNGDAAADQLLRCVAKVEKTYPNFYQTRPVLIHGQILRSDQLPVMKKLGVIPSFFAAHVYYWGDVHAENLGMERAQHVSPAAAANKEEIPFTFHQDSPVIPPNMLETLWCAVNRKTKRGQMFQEAVNVSTALKAVTINAAYQYHEETEKGSITPGKRANLVVLDQNPLTVPVETLKDIRVLQTICDGAVVFSR